MGLCPREKCRWYGEDKVDMEGNRIHRKCYYGPQCWKGEMDMIGEMIGFAMRRKFPKKSKPTSE